MNVICTTIRPSFPLKILIAPTQMHHSCAHWCYVILPFIDIFAQTDKSELWKWRGTETTRTRQWWSRYFYNLDLCVAMSSQHKKQFEHSLNWASSSRTITWHKWCGGTKSFQYHQLTYHQSSHPLNYPVPVRSAQLGCMTITKTSLISAAKCRNECRACHELVQQTK